MIQINLGDVVRIKNCDYARNNGVVNEVGMIVMNREDDDEEFFRVYIKKADKSLLFAIDELVLIKDELKNKHYGIVDFCKKYYNQKGEEKCSTQ